jgi:hypothetical protein
LSKWANEKLRENLKKSDKDIRKQIITNEILRIQDEKGDIPNDALKILENQYIRNGKLNPIFKKHRTTRRDEIKETLIEMGFDV